VKKLRWYKQETSSSCLPACLREETIISHALVVQKIEAKYVHVLDPEEGERKLTRDAFEILWSAAGWLVIVVKKS
jgi:predicted double-glycine peptidase